MRPRRELTETGVAWGWVGLFNVPVSLIATTLATLRAARRARGAEGPKPVTALIITAVILALALAVFAILIFSTRHRPQLTRAARSNRHAALQDILKKRS